MADIVHIRDRLDRLPRKPQKCLEDAQVLLFTGVRYERFGFAQPQQPQDVHKPASSH